MSIQTFGTVQYQHITISDITEPLTLTFEQDNVAVNCEGGINDVYTAFAGETVSSNRRQVKLTFPDDMESCVCTFGTPITSFTIPDERFQFPEVLPYGFSVTHYPVNADPTASPPVQGGLRVSYRTPVYDANEIPPRQYSSIKVNFSDHVTLSNTIGDCTHYANGVEIDSYESLVNGNKVILEYVKDNVAPDTEYVVQCNQFYAQAGTIGDTTRTMEGLEVSFKYNDGRIHAARFSSSATLTNVLFAGIIASASVFAMLF